MNPRALKHRDTYSPAEKQSASYGLLFMQLSYKHINFDYSSQTDDDYV